jgi:hypothetical protein
MGTEENKLLKSRIIEACKQHQLETIANLKREMDEHQQLANDYGPPKDRYDAFRSQMLRRRDIFAEQLQKANEELFTLEKIKPNEVKTKIEFGAIVITDKQKLFVATSMGKISIDNELYFCISPAVPVYRVIEGLKAGDITTFNNNSIKIVDVF